MAWSDRFSGQHSILTAPTRVKVPVKWVAFAAKRIYDTGTTATIDAIGY